MGESQVLQVLQSPWSARTALANALADGYVRVKFDVDGGSLVDAQIIVEGAKATAPDDPTKEHYTFEWIGIITRHVLLQLNFAVDEFPMIVQHCTPSGLL